MFGSRRTISDECFDKFGVAQKLFDLFLLQPCLLYTSVEGKWKISYGYDITSIPTDDPFLSRAGVQTTMTAISRTSKNPVRALKLLELLHKDPYILNLLCYGLEGRDYTKDPENPNRMVRESGSYRCV